MFYSISNFNRFYSLFWFFNTYIVKIKNSIENFYYYIHKALRRDYKQFFMIYTGLFSRKSMFATLFIILLNTKRKVNS
jgi:uncharacterized membrane protein